MSKPLYETSYLWGTKYVVTQDSSGKYNIHKIRGEFKQFVVKCDLLINAKHFANELFKAYSDGYKDNR